MPERIQDAVNDYLPNLFPPSPETQSTQGALQRQTERFITAKLLKGEIPQKVFFEYMEAFLPRIRL